MRNFLDGQALTGRWLHQIHRVAHYSPQYVSADWHRPPAQFSPGPTDTTTSLVWLDLDNFWDSTTTYDLLNSLLTGSGFHLATLTELVQLQASIPAIPANFSSEVLIVGGNYLGNPHPGADRGLIWGVYNDGSSADGISYSWKYDFSTNWSFAANAMAASTTLSSSNNENQDLGAWVVADSVGGQIPEPSTLTIFGLGGLGLAFGAVRRRFRKVA